MHYAPVQVCPPLLNIILVLMYKLTNPGVSFREANAPECCAGERSANVSRRPLQPIGLGDCKTPLALQCIIQPLLVTRDPANALIGENRERPQPAGAPSS